MATGGGQEGRGAGANLTREQVLDAALALAERQGPDQLTVRGLAAALSVAATSLYWHVGDKEALLDGVAERVITRFGRIRVRGADPATRLRSAARSLRTMLAEQAALVALVHTCGRTAELLQPARRVFVRELVAAGLDPEGTALGTQALVNLVIGSVLLDRQVARQPVQRETAEQLWRPDDVPGLPSVLRALSRPPDDQRQFEFALRILVDALTAAPGATGRRRATMAGHLREETP